MAYFSDMAHVAQLVEHVLGKDEVTRSIRVVGSMRRLTRPGANMICCWRPVWTPQVFNAMNTSSVSGEKE